MKTINVFALDAVDHLVHPEEFDDVTVDSPASVILTDFRSHNPHLIKADISAVEALDIMSREGVYIKLAVNSSGDLVGVLSLDDLSEQSILLTQNLHRVKRHEVSVSDLMVPRSTIRAIEYEEFSRCTVADIIYTLQRHGQQYYIVVDSSQHHIRGVVSSTEISRRVHAPVNVERKPTVVDIVSSGRPHVY